MLAAVPRPPLTGDAAYRLRVVRASQRSASTSARQDGTAARRPAAAASAAGAATIGGGTERQQVSDLSGLTDEEIQQTLSLRRLSERGGRAEQERRLAAYMADPSAFPDAACRPTRCWLVAGRLFAGQAQLRTHIQQLLQLLRGKPEVLPGHREFPFLLALLQRHPRYPEKVAPPVAAFRVREVIDPMGDLRPFVCFEFRDARGTWDDFSYRKCIDFKPSYTEVLGFRDAMRYALKDQHQAYRMACAKPGPRGPNQRVWTCDVCSRRSNSTRIEYEQPTFGALVRGFCESTTLQAPPVDGRDPVSGRGCFTDEVWLAEWRRYHRVNAGQLRLTCMRCIKARQAAQQAKREAAAAATSSLEALLLQMAAAARGKAS